MTVSASHMFRAVRHAWRMSNPWSPMIRDARGQQCPVYRLDRFWLQAGRAADLPREQFEHIRAQLLEITNAGMGARPMKLWLLAGGYAVFFAWMFYVSRVPWVVLICWAVIIGCFVWSALTYNRRIPKAGRVLIAAALIRENRCASCAYDLRSTPRGADGLTICPECGAAWKLPSGAEMPAVPDRGPPPCPHLPSP